MSSTGPATSRRRGATSVAACVALTMAVVTSMIGTAGAVPSANDKTCKKPSGEPILFSMIAPLSGPNTDADFLGGAQASAASINCDGGVQGRPVKILGCNGNIFQDPNLGPNCAREAIAKGVVASTALASNDNSVVQAFHDAGIPMVGVPLAPVALARSTSFPIGAGIAGQLAGMAAKLYDDGHHRIRIMVTDVPGASAILGIANAGLTPRGAKVLDPALLPADEAQDDSAVIQTAIQDTDAIILTLTQTSIDKVVPELRAAGFKGPLATATTVVKPEQPSVKDFLLVGSFYPASANNRAGIKAFNADMDRFNPKDKERGLEGEIMAWESVQVTADALKQASAITPAALMTVLQTYKVDFGVAPVIDFANGGGKFGVPRIFTQYVIAQKVKNKKFVVDGDFFDPTVPPTSATTTTTKQ